MRHAQFETSYVQSGAAEGARSRELPRSMFGFEQPPLENCDAARPSELRILLRRARRRGLRARRAPQSMRSRQRASPLGGKG